MVGGVRSLLFCANQPAVSLEPSSPAQHCVALGTISSFSKYHFLPGQIFLTGFMHEPFISWTKTRELSPTDVPDASRPG